MENNNQFSPQPAAEQTSPVKKSFFGELKTAFKTYPAQLIFVIVITFIIASIFSGAFCAGTPSKENNDNTSGQTVISDSTPDSSEQETDTSAAESTTATTAAASDVSGGKLGDYYVEIVSYRIGKDYEDKPAIFITYNFTNNSSEAASFMWSTSETLFQDGIQLDSAIVYDDPKYDSESSMREIKPGVTIPVESAFILRNTSSPVDVEVSELISLDDAKVTKTFNLS